MAVKEMLQVIVQGLVDDPSSVRIEEVQDKGETVYEVNVADGDLGKVIGKEGKIANALRAIASAVAAQDNKSAHVEIVS